ncbi:M1 family metallopeptidase [Sphingomonas sp. IC-11]|uniref:M1 family metallopeptidase n=1 Tax=Sphingomonas sp. IC-11 TaxID=2898528 RepID=UPI001E2EEC32|nr:M1 family metallopeptidase [Sphingomonas sp. IC-11]MCD2315136.1 M1 family metallopeptidase [Sphingomonas sp. IC-11]
MISSPLWLAALLLTPASLPGPTGLPQKGEPPLTAQTQISGGPRPSEQTAVTFDHADLSIEVRPKQRRIEGSAILSFTARAPLASLVIDLDRNLPVSAVAVDGEPLPKRAWSNPDGQLRIALPRPLAAGEKVSARIDYAGTPHVAANAPWDDGMVWSTTPDGRPWIASTTEGYGCDLLWPCLDFPAGEPRSVDLHIIVPAGLKAPANGRLIGVETFPDGRTRWNWQARQPNTYAIALAIGPFEEVTAIYQSRYGNKIPLHYWHLPGKAEQARALFAEFAPTLDFFEEVIGPYPFADEKLGVVETPHMGMEHQTINAYGNNYAKAPEGFDWLFQHELSHEWFANQMTAANWDDYWLHEGFAQYMQPLYGQWREGDGRYLVMLETQRNRITNTAPVVRDKLLTEEDVYEPSRGGAGTDIYFKGAWTLHTLRWLIGDGAFFAATRRLVYGRRDPQPGNFAPRYTSTREFEAIVKEESGRDLGWFFDAYLRRAALPELVETRSGDRLRLEWKSGGPFPMPIEVKVGGRIERVNMDAGAAELTLPPGAHVVIDPMARVLRRSIAVERFQAWQATQARLARP